MDYRINSIAPKSLQVWSSNQVKTASNQSSAVPFHEVPKDSPVANLIPTNPVVLSAESQAKAKSAIDALNQVKDLLQNAKQSVIELSKSTKYKGTERLLSTVSTTANEIIQHASANGVPVFRHHQVDSSPAIRAYQKNIRSYQNNQTSTESITLTNAFRLANTQLVGNGSLASQLQRLSDDPQTAISGINRALESVEAMTLSFKNALE